MVREIQSAVALACAMWHGHRLGRQMRAVSGRLSILLSLHRHVDLSNLVDLDLCVSLYTYYTFFKRKDQLQGLSVIHSSTLRRITVEFPSIWIPFLISSPSQKIWTKWVMLRIITCSLKARMSCLQ